MMDYEEMDELSHNIACEFLVRDDDEQWFDMLKARVFEALESLAKQKDEEDIKVREFIKGQIGDTGKCINLLEDIGYMTAEISDLRLRLARMEKALKEARVDYESEPLDDHQRYALNMIDKALEEDSHE